MTYLIILALYFLALFAVFFIARRSVGLPALGLATGALLANLWTAQLTPVVVNAGVVIHSPPMASIVAVILTLLPALLVISRSPKHHSHLHALGSAVLFALLATALTYNAFANAVVLDAASKQVISVVLPYSSIAITVCLVIAVIELIIKHPHKIPQKKHK